MPADTVKHTPLLRVKALEWEPYPNPVFAGPDVAVAYVEFRCFYQVQRDPNAHGFIAYLAPKFGTLFWECKGHESLDAAKAAAQADYERRILSAVEIDPDQSRRSPDPVREKLVEALAEARQVVDAAAGDNRPAIAWAITVRDHIDGALSLVKGEQP